MGLSPSQLAAGWRQLHADVSLPLNPDDQAHPGALPRLTNPWLHLSHKCAMVNWVYSELDRFNKHSFHPLLLQ